MNIHSNNEAIKTSLRTEIRRIQTNHSKISEERKIHSTEAAHQINATNNLRTVSNTELVHSNQANSHHVLVFIIEPAFETFSRDSTTRSVCRSVERSKTLSFLGWF